MQLSHLLPNLHCTKEIIAQFIIQQKHSKRQDKASKYTRINTSRPPLFSITSSDIDALPYLPFKNTKLTVWLYSLYLSA